MLAQENTMKSYPYKFRDGNKKNRLPLRVDLNLLPPAESNAVPIVVGDKLYYVDRTVYETQLLPAALAAREPKSPRQLKCPQEPSTALDPLVRTFEDATCKECGCKLEETKRVFTFEGTAARVPNLRCVGCGQYRNEIIPASQISQRPLEQERGHYIVLPDFDSPELPQAPRLPIKNEDAYRVFSIPTPNKKTSPDDAARIWAQYKRDYKKGRAQLRDYEKKMGEAQSDSIFGKTRSRDYACDRCGGTFLRVKNRSLVCFDCGQHITYRVEKAVDNMSATLLGVPIAAWDSKRRENRLAARTTDEEFIIGFGGSKKRLSWEQIQGAAAVHAVMTEGVLPRDVIHLAPEVDGDAETWIRNQVARAKERASLPYTSLDLMRATEKLAAHFKPPLSNDSADDRQNVSSTSVYSTGVVNRDAFVGTETVDTTPETNSTDYNDLSDEWSPHLPKTRQAPRINVNVGWRGGRELFKDEALRQMVTGPYAIFEYRRTIHHKVDPNAAFDAAQSKIHESERVKRYASANIALRVTEYMDSIRARYGRLPVPPKTVGVHRCLVCKTNRPTFEGAKRHILHSHRDLVDQEINENRIGYRFDVPFGKDK